MQRSGGEGAGARALKWQWIQHGLAAPGAADKIRLYAEYLQKMERALQESDWLVGRDFTMADVAMAPYLNRLAALAMEGLWSDGRLPRVEDWFERIRARPTFEPAFVAWMPAALGAEMRANGEKSWPEIAALLNL
jgi:glutathione S-transferase